MIHIGRFLNTPLENNYKDPNVGKKTFEVIKSYLETNIHVANNTIKFKNIEKPNTLQIFVGPRTKYSGKDITKYMSKKYIEKIKALLQKHNAKLIIHSNYLTQLTRVQDNKQCLNAILGELRSAAHLNAVGVVIHIGSKRNDETEDMVIKKIIDGAKLIIERHAKNHPNKKAQLLIETSSGKGNEMAIKLDVLGNIIASIKKRLGNSNKRLLGVCVDTCHIFSAGYDIRNYESAVKTIKDIEQYIGISNIKCMHFNDSQNELNSRTDCHQNIGCGYIGSVKLGGSLTGLQALILLAKKYGIPVILETPNSMECKKKCIVAKQELSLVKSLGMTEQIINDMKKLKFYNGMINYCD